MNITFYSVFSFVYHENSQFSNFLSKTHELIYFLTGKGSTTINENTYSYKPHTVCFTHSGDIRSHKCNKETKYICIRFLGSRLLSDLESGIYSCNNDEILSLFIDIKNEFDNKNYKYYDMCNLMIGQILIKLSRLHIVEKKDINIYKLIKEIDNNFSFNKSVKEMADSVSYSYDHFRHKFKEITGLSPTKYIINKRIENACKLLLKNKYTCTDIALLCGFASPSQFSSIFKRIIGVSPKKYQKIANYSSDNQDNGF